jgi:hypothetical protein
MNQTNSEGPTLFPAAKPQGGLSLAQALAQLHHTPRPWTSDTGELLVIRLEGFEVKFSGVHSLGDLLEWFRNRGAMVSPLEENCHPTRPPLQQDLPFADPFADPRNWSGGDDPPPDDAFL